MDINLHIIMVWLLLWTPTLIMTNAQCVHSNKNFFSPFWLFVIFAYLQWMTYSLYEIHSTNKLSWPSPISNTVLIANAVVWRTAQLQYLWISPKGAQISVNYFLFMVSVENLNSEKYNCFKNTQFELPVHYAAQKVDTAKGLWPANNSINIVLQ